MPESYFFAQDIESLVKEISPDTIVSRTYFEAEKMKAILFGFASGQELSEHTAARPAILHFLAGEAELTLGEDTKSVQPGSWTYMQPHLAHSIVAKSTVIMLLYLL
ncbi:MAG TPA: cupin [Chloroflexi bacterium]|nr:cupin [Chloroflexota bacterium]HBY08025.1 cupin [Chloroflexota bacterium]